MFSVIKKHPIVSLGLAAAAGWYFFIRPKAAQAAQQALGGGGGGGGGSDFQDVLILQPGAIQETIPAGGEIDLQLPLGAAWDQGQPVTQAQGSNIGATVDPLVPIGAEQQIWRGIRGTGTIVAQWIDDKGNPQTTNIAVSTS